MKRVDKIIAIMVAIAIIPAIMLIVNNSNYETVYTYSGDITVESTDIAFADLELTNDYVDGRLMPVAFDNDVPPFPDMSDDYIRITKGGNVIYDNMNDILDDSVILSITIDTSFNIIFVNSDNILLEADYGSGINITGDDVIIEFYTDEVVELDNPYNFLIGIIPLIFVAGIIVVIRSKKLNI